MRIGLIGKLTLTSVLLGISLGSSATYNANISGVVTDVVVYTESGGILFRINTQPSSHPACNPYYFAVDGSIATDIRKQFVARLLAAQASQQAIYIGYDNAGNCVGGAGGWIQAYRAG